jgi:hypothetical protein
MYIPSFVKIDLGVKKLTGWYSLSDSMGIT